MFSPAQPAPRILAAQAPKYTNKMVTVIGEVTNITPHANTATLRMPDDSTMIVLLPNTSITIEPARLTEVTGRLITRGNIEAMWVHQFEPKETAKFNKSLYMEAVQVMDAFIEHYQA